jgi:hypothetical protein
LDPAATTCAVNEKFDSTPWLLAIRAFALSGSPESKGKELIGRRNSDSFLFIAIFFPLAYSRI